MNIIHQENNFDRNNNFLLALHSSTENLGIGLIKLNDTDAQFQTSTIHVGRNLSKYLFRYIEELLPHNSWSKIKRLAVATGPGGFTGTRLTIIFARTIAQQLCCPIDGISSFQLMAHRFAKEYDITKKSKSFWIKQELKRRGTVAGQYQIIQNSKSIEIKELTRPMLLKENQKIDPALNAIDDVNQDIKILLDISFNLYKKI